MATPEQIKAIRAHLGESQATFGARFGVDQSTIHRWETEGVPARGTTRVAIERVLADIILPSPAPDQPAAVSP